MGVVANIISSRIWREVDLPDREQIKKKGGLYWQPPGLNEYELLLPSRAG